VAAGTGQSSSRWSDDGVSVTTGADGIAAVSARRARQLDRMTADSRSVTAVTAHFA